MRYSTRHQIVALVVAPGTLCLFEVIIAAQDYVNKDLQFGVSLSPALRLGRGRRVVVFPRPAATEGQGSLHATFLLHFFDPCGGGCPSTTADSRAAARTG
jgi:hypothetical protein